MSNMLEQAIVDATALREAAAKQAESAIIEKYSSEVRHAVEKLLEQDELATLPGEEESIESTAMEQVPLAHVADDEEIVVVDLDDILAAADAEDEEDLDQPVLDREEIADEVGLPLDIEDDISPANRSDEVEIDESDLVSMFKEILTVNIPEVELERAESRLEQAEKELLS